MIRSAAARQNVMALCLAMTLGIPAPATLLHGVPRPDASVPSRFVGPELDSEIDMSTWASAAPDPSRLTVVVPDSIDATGVSDASAALNEFIAGLPDQTTIVFPPGAVYRLVATGLKLAGRSGLRLIGDDAALLLQTDGEHTDSAAFWLSNLGQTPTTDIEIRGFLVVGDNVAAGTPAAYDGREGASGLWTGRGTQRLVLHDTTFRDLYGHGVLLSDDSTGTWTSDVIIRDNVFDGIGTMGLAVVAARDVWIEGNSVTDVGWTAIDIEPEDDGQGAERIVIRDNTFARYGWHVESSNWWLALVPDDNALNAAFREITVESNVVEQGPATADNGNQDGVGGLAIRADKPNPKSGITVTGNSTTDDDIRGADRSVMTFAWVDGLMVALNTQPITGESALVRCDECADVVTGPNAT